MMLPLELLELIPDGTYLRLCLGVGLPSRRQLLRDGGPAILVETVLANGADIKALLQLRTQIPADIAIVKAVGTKNAKILKRVCILWNTWYSKAGRELACSTGFKWGVDHLLSPKPVDMNLFYLKTGELDKINGEVSFSWHYNAVASKVVDERLYGMVSTFDLVYAYSLLGDIEGLCREMEKDMERLLDLELALRVLLRYNFSSVAIELYQKFGAFYLDDPQQTIERLLVEMRDAKGMRLLGMENANVYEVIFTMAVDKDSFNKQLRQDRQRVINTLEEFYDRLDLTNVDFNLMTSSDLDTINSNTSIELGDNARWIGLDEVSSHDSNRRLDFRYSFQTEDTRLNMIRTHEIEDINMIFSNCLYSGTHLKELRTLVETCGIGVMAQMNEDTRVMISPMDDKEDALWFYNLCVDLGYSGIAVNRANRTEMHNRTLYYPTKSARDTEIALQMYFGDQTLSNASTSLCTA
jgi:hypothetical protein